LGIVKLWKHCIWLSFLLAFSSAFSQVTWDGDAGTNLWSDGANWNPDGVPGDGDDVVISGTYTVSVTSSDSCNSLTITPTDANNNTVSLTITNGARLGVANDITLNDENRANNRNLLNVFDGATLYVGGNLNMTKDEGASNNNDMLLRVYDDNSRVVVTGDIIADFSQNNNNSNDMGIRMRQDATVQATNFTVTLGGAQQSDTLLAMNSGGTSGDGATFHVTNDFSITSNSGTMDCIISQDYDASLDIDNNFSYSATAGNAFFWYMDRDAVTDVANDLTITKDGDEDLFLYLNQNNQGTGNDAQLIVGGNLQIDKTDGDFCYIRLSGDADITTTGSFTVNTSNEDGNEDNVNLILNDDAGVSAGDDLEFSLNDDSAVDLLIQLNDNSTVTTVDSFITTFTNATFFELEMNSASSMTVGTDFFFTNSSSSDFPIIDMQGTSTLTINQDLIWIDNTSDDADDSGFFLDEDASISVADTFRVDKTDDGDLFFYLNQSADGSANDARITAASLVVNRSGTATDDLFFFLSNDADIITSGYFVINSTASGGDGDDINIDLTDDAGISCANFSASYTDANQHDLFIQLNDNSTFTTTAAFTVTQTDATFFEIEMNGASGLAVGTDFIFTNSTSSDIPIIDMQGTSTFTVGEDLLWTDNSTDDADDTGFYLDEDASITVSDSFRIDKTDDGDLFLFLNQTTDGSANDAQISTGSMVINWSGAAIDDLFIRLSNDADIIASGDFVINGTNSGGDGDDIAFTMNDNAGIACDNFIASYSDGDDHDMYIQLNDNSTFNTTNAFTVTQTDAHFFEIELNSGSMLTVGTDFTFTNSSTSNLPVLDLDGTSTLSIGQDFYWNDNSDVDDGNSGFFMDSDAQWAVADSIVITKPVDGDLFFDMNVTTDGAGSDAQISCSYLVIDMDNCDFLFLRMFDHSDISVTNNLLITADQTAPNDEINIALNDDSGVDVDGNASISMNSTNTEADIDFNILSTGAFDVAGDLTTSITGDDFDADLTSGQLNVGGNWDHSMNTAGFFGLTTTNASQVNVAGNWTSTLTDAATFDIFQFNTASITIGGDFTFTNDANSQRFILDHEDSASFTVGEDLIINNNSTDGNDGETRITLDQDATLTVGDSLFINDTDDDQTQIQMNTGIDGAGDDAQMSVGYLVIQKDQGDEVQILIYRDADLTVTNDMYVEVDDIDLNNNINFTILNDAGVNIGGDLTFDVDNQPVDLDLDMNFSSSDSLNVTGNVVLNLTGDNIDIDMTDTYWGVGGNYTATVSSGDFYDVDVFGAGVLAVAGDYTVSTDATSERIRHDLNGTSSMTIGQDMILTNASEDGESGETQFQLDDDASLTVADSILITDSGDDQVIIFLNQAADGSAADAQISAGYLVIDKDSENGLYIRLSNDADITITNNLIVDMDNPLTENFELTMNGASGIDVNGFVDIDFTTDSIRTIDFNLNSSGNFDVAQNMDITTNGENLDIDMTGSGGWIIGTDLTVTGTDANDYATDINGGGTLSVGDDWITSWTSSDYFDLNVSSTSSVAVTDRFVLGNSVGGGFMQIDLDNSATFTAVDVMVTQNGSSTDQDNGIYIDSDASMTITDSVYWVQPNDGLTRLFLNQTVDGSGADAQFTAASYTVDKDGGNNFQARLSQGSDITITNNFTVDAENLVSADHVEFRLSNDAGADINGNLILSNSSSGDNDVYLYHFGTGNLDVAGDIDLDVSGDDFDVDITGGGSVLIGGDLLMDMSNADDALLTVTNSTLTVGDDWLTNLRSSDDFNMDATGTADINITDRAEVRLGEDQGFVQFDLDDQATFDAVDLIVRDSTADSDSENGIWLDDLSTFTLTDSLDWIQPSGGRFRMHLNQSVDGTGNIDAQFAANSVTISHDNGQAVSVRVGDHGDITVTNNFSHTGGTYATNNNVEFSLTDNGAIDINGNLIVDVNSTNNTTIDMNNTGAGNLDIAGDMDLDLTGNNIDIDYTSSGDLIVGGDALMDMSSANALSSLFTNSAAFTIGDDWITNMTNSTFFDLDVRNSAAISVNDRFVFTNDANSTYFQMDMEDASTFSAEDYIVTQNSNSEATASAILLDSNAAMTIADSLYWVQTTEGQFLMTLNASEDGSTDAQVSANSMTVDMDNANDLSINTNQNSDITIAANMTLDADNLDDGEHITIDMDDDSGIDINGNLIISGNSSGNNDLLINSSSTADLDVAGFIDLDLTGDDMDIDITGGGAMIAGQDLLMDMLNADDILLNLNSGDITVGDDWLTNMSGSDLFDANIVGTSTVTINDRIEFDNDAGSGYVQYDMDGTASMSAVDMIVVQNDNTAATENGIWLDTDASLTLTDSLFWTQPNAGRLRLHLNEATDGSGADAQVAASSITLVQGNGEQLSTRVYDDGDITVTNNFTITATDMLVNNNVEIGQQDQGSIDINGNLIISLNTANSSDVQLRNSGSGNLDVAGFMDVDLTGDDIDMDYTGTGDLIVGTDVLWDLNTADDVEMTINNGAGITIGDDWINTLTDADLFDLNVLSSSAIAVTDRFIVTNDGSATTIQVDMDGTSTFTATDFIVNQNTNTSGSNSGIFIDSDAAMAITDSIYWVQPTEGNVLIYLNQTVNGSSADAQLAVGSLTIDLDNADDLIIELDEDADITITNNMTLDADNLDNGEHVEIDMQDQSGIDINGSLLMSNSSSGANNDLYIVHNSSGNMDIAGIMDLDLGGDDMDIDIIGGGDIIVGGDVFMDVLNGDDILMTMTGSDYTMGDDWFVTFNNGGTFNADLTTTAGIAVTDRIEIIKDEADGIVQFDLDNNATMTAVDMIVNDSTTTSEGDNGFFLDNDAAVTFTDSLLWTQTEAGELFLHLNQAAAGSVNHAQFAANSITFDKTEGHDIFIRVDEDGDITVTNNFTITATNFINENHVEIELEDQGGIDINQDLLVSVNSTNSNDIDLENFGSGNLDVARDMDLVVTGDDIDLDYTSSGGLIVGRDLLMDLSTADNIEMDFTGSGTATIGDDWESTLTTADNFDLNITGSYSIAVTDRFIVTLDSDGDQAQVDLDGTASLTAQDAIITNNSSTNGINNGFFIDQDATVTINDSLLWTQSTESTVLFYLNQNVDGSSADAQLSVNSLTIDIDNADDVLIRGGDNSDITVTTNFIIDADNLDTGGDIEFTMSDNGAIDVNGNMILSNVSSGDSDVDLFHASAGNIDIAGILDVDLDGGDDINFDLTGTGDLIVAGDVTMDLNNGDNVELFANSSSNMTFGDDWFTTITGSDNYDFDISGSAQIAVTDRFIVTLDSDGNQAQIDMAGTATLAAQDAIITNNSNTNNIDNGIFIDQDAAITITDSLRWNQTTESDLFLYLNQATDGSAAHAQLTANSLTFDIDNADDMFVRGGGDSDINIATDFNIDADNLDNGGDITFIMTDASGIDVNGNMILSNVSPNDNNVDIFHSSSGNIDIAGILDADVDGGDDMDWDFTGTGDLIVAGDVTIDMNDGDNVLLLANNSANMTLGDDFTITMSNSDNFDFDISGSAQIATTDRFTVNMDATSDQIQFDMAGTGAFSAVDLDINQNSDNNVTSGIFMDGDATFTITDSIDWFNSRNGSIYFDLNQSAAGSGADAQLTADYFIVRKDTGNLMRFQLDEDADIIVANDFTVTCNQNNNNQNLQIDLQDESGMDVNGDVSIDINTTNNTTFDFNHGGNGAFDVAGDFNAIFTNANDFDADFTGNGDFNVGGDLNVTQSSGDNIDFDLTNDFTVSVTGDVNITMPATSDGRIRLDLDNTSEWNTSQDLIIDNQGTDANNGETRIGIDRDAVMTISDSLFISHDGRDNIEIDINQENPGSADDAQLNTSYLVLDMINGDECEILVSDNGDINVSNDFDLHYEDSNDNNDDLVVRASNQSSITIQGSATINYDNSISTNVNDFTFDLNDSAQFNVGPSAGPYNTESLNMIMTIGDDITGTLDGIAQLNVYGDWNLTKTAGDDINFSLNAAAGTGAQINVFGDFDIDNTENADVVNFDFNQTSLLNVDGDIDMLGILSEGIFELNFDGNAELELAGNFVQGTAPNNFGTLDMNDDALLEMNGSAVQQIIPANDAGGADFFEYQRVWVNNSFGTVPQLITGGEVTVTDSIRYIDGILASVSDSLLILSDNGGVSDASDESHTTGPFRKVGNEAFIFPVGNGEQYRLCAISAPSAASDIFTATYFDDNPWPIYDGGLRENPIANISSREYWIMDRDNGSSSVFVTLSWDTNSGGVGDPDSLLVARWDDVDMEWKNEGNFTTTGTTIEGTVQSSAAIQNFSPFTLASTNATLNPLPIELLSFDAQKQDEQSVLVSWTTVTETDNDYFEVQRSTNGEDFEVIAIVDGAGTSTEILNYEQVDDGPSAGWNYYRLKQVDFDGASSLSETRQVWFDAAEVADASIDVWPNPVGQDFFNIALKGFDFESERSVIELRDLTGRPVAISVTPSVSGFHVEINESVSSGYYFVKLSTEGQVFTKQLFVH